MYGYFDPAKIEIWRNEELSPSMEFISNQIGTSVRYFSKIYSAFDLEIEGLRTQWSITGPDTYIQVNQRTGIVRVTQKTLSGNTYTLRASIAIEKFKHIFSEIILVTDYDEDVDNVNLDKFTIITRKACFVPYGGRSSCIIHWGDGTTYNHDCAKNVHCKTYPHEGPWTISLKNFIGPGTFRLEWD